MLKHFEVVIHVETFRGRHIGPDSNTGRDIAVYTNCSIHQSVMQIQPGLSYDEVCLLETRLRGGDILLFGCFYRSPTPTSMSEQNKGNLHKLRRSLSRKKYSHKCFVGDFNYRDINWVSWTTPPPPPHNEDSNEAEFVETIRDCYLHQHIDEPSRRRGND